MSVCLKKTVLYVCLILMVVLPPLSSLASGFSADPSAIEEKTKSVLMLEVYDGSDQLIATGSGFVMFDGMTLVTNYHVIEDASYIVAESDEGYQYYVTKILTASEEKDIAILQFMAPTVMRPLDYSDGEILRGSPVVAIGSPIGLKNTVSMGNVSSYYEEDGIHWIQFTAPISSGSSGGALLNDDGEVIGITSGAYTEGQNLNLAVSITDAVALYSDWDGTTGSEIGAAGQSASAADKEPVDFTPWLTEEMGFSAGELFSDDFSRAAFAVMLSLDASECFDDTETAGEVLLGGKAYLGMLSSSELLLVGPDEKGNLIMMLYSENDHSAYFASFSDSSVDVESLMRSECGESYARLDTASVIEVVDMLENDTEGN